MQIKIDPSEPDLSGFATLPPGVRDPKPEPFTLHVPDDDIATWHALLQASPIAPPTFYSSADRGMGVTTEWLTRAKHVWLNEFDWRTTEQRINAVPSFRVRLTDPLVRELEVHFAALFSKKEDAVPVVFMHGWPGSFLEFFPMMSLLAKEYIPETLPFHVIVPSLTGYTLSPGPPVDHEFSLADQARVIDELMVALGFGAKGYIAQGGDIGSFLARVMSATMERCKALHVNLLPVEELEYGEIPPDEQDSPEIQTMLKRSRDFNKKGRAYALEHGTRPATIGMILSSSPLALLAWIGEKMLEWVDDREPLELETILTMVSFYWYTNTISRCLYPYCTFSKGTLNGKMGIPTSKDKPLGFSMFPKEVWPTPMTWAKKVYPNTVGYEHDKGGHFAALEQPEVFLADIKDFVERTAHLCN